MNDLTVLSRPVMTVAEAASQLHVSAKTLRRWLDGHQAATRTYEPILRPEPTGDLDMTWGEVVEAKYLRLYRQHLPLQKLRPFVAALRNEFNVPYPLAHFKPYVTKNRELVYDLQRSTNVPDELLVVFKGSHNQYLLSPLVEQTFLDVVVFDDGGAQEALRLRPSGSLSPVVMDPLRSSGAATVKGVRCDALAELVRAGQPIDEVADDFDLAASDVQAALSYTWAA